MTAEKQTQYIVYKTQTKRTSEVCDREVFAHLPRLVPGVLGLAVAQPNLRRANRVNPITESQVTKVESRIKLVTFVDTKTRSGNDNGNGNGQTNKTEKEKVSSHACMPKTAILIIFHGTPLALPEDPNQHPTLDSIGVERA